MTESTVDVEALLQDEEAKQALPKELREYAERQKAKAEENEKKLQERDAADRDRKLNEFISSKGLPDEAKDLIGDQDPEEWYGKYGKLLGTSTASQEAPEAPAGDEYNEPTPKQPVQQPSAPALTPEQMQALQGVVSQAPKGQPGEKPVETQVDDAMSGAKSLEEVYAKLAQVPGVYDQ